MKTNGASKSFDKRKVRFFNCQQWVHFAYECQHSKGKEKKESNDEACAAQEDSDSDVVLLIATTYEDLPQFESWFLDTRCSNHMTSHKEWLSDFDTTRARKVQFEDDITLSAEGVCNSMLKRKNGKSTLIESVLHVL